MITLIIPKDRSEGFILKKWMFSDLHDLIQYANNKKIADNLTNAFPYHKGRWKKQGCNWKQN